MAKKYRGSKLNKIVEKHYDDIEKFIKKNADSKKISNIQRYLKNNAGIVYGIPMKRLKLLFVRQIHKFDSLNARQIYSLVNELFISKAYEKQIIASMILDGYFYKLDSNMIINIVKKHISKGIIVSWAIADQIALYVFNKVNDKSFLLEFTKSTNYLLRRCSVVVYAEMSLNNNDIDMLIVNIRQFLEEKNEYVASAAGWACRNILKYNKERYFQFIDEVSHLMPRIMLRTAIRTLDEDTRKNILISSKDNRPKQSRKRCFELESES